MKKALKDNQMDKTKITGGFFKFYQDLLVEKMVPYQLGKFYENDSLKALYRAAGYHVPNLKGDDAPVMQEGSNAVMTESANPRIQGTLLEAIGYSLMLHDDPKLRTKVDEIIDILEENQLPDGYLSPPVTSKNPDKRFLSLMMSHEHFGMGTLLEGLITYYRVTGNEKALKIAKGIGDCLHEWFGRNEGQIRGYCGHSGVEVGLFRLYKLTGEKKYLDITKFFVDERGQKLPNGMHYYDWEQKRNLEKYGKPQVSSHFMNSWADEHRPFFENYEYFQAHKPARDIEDPVGHAVRATYFYAAMTDVAAETNDEELFAACKKIFKNMEENNIYLNGAVGQDYFWEGIGKAYDLPSDIAYAETCASIGVMLFAHRMLKAAPESHYADIMERTLYNSVISGVELDGEHYFYCNILEMDPKTLYRYPKNYPYFSQRFEWWRTPCCPPNIARTLGGLTQFIYLYDDKNLWVNLFMENTGIFKLDGKDITVSQHTEYPWDGKVVIEVKGDADFALRVRIPSWSKKIELSLNGKAIEIKREHGYAVIDRSWVSGDKLEIQLDMSVRRIYPNPRIPQVNNKVAFMRGPILYCMEEEDNGEILSRIAVSPDAKVEEKYEKDLLGGVYSLSLEAQRLKIDDCEELYRTERPAREKMKLKLIPYYAWANRNEGEMRVYIDELIK